MPVSPLSETPGQWGRLRWWLKLISITGVLSFLIAYFLLVPAVERLASGVFRAAGAFAQIAYETREFVRLCHVDACQQIEANEEIVNLLGLPIVCAPLESVEWIESKNGPALEYSFDVRGPVAVGRAQTRFVERERRVELTTLVVTVDEHTIFVPTMPILRP